MIITPHASQQEWDEFLLGQPFRPFLQSWTMGEVFRDINEEPLRLLAKENGRTVGLCQAILVPARRGRHLAVHYGPLVASPDVLSPLLHALADHARDRGCSFLRLSPFVPEDAAAGWTRSIDMPTMPAPMHLLGEHVWYLPLTNSGKWSGDSGKKTEEELLMAMRKTTRNLIRRAEKDGVTVRASENPSRDIDAFIDLHEETRQRHAFTPYRSRFFRAQVERFARRKECTLYLAEHQGELLASSIHMHLGGETSYHHGASRQTKVPASYLLQWTAIKDALRRGDHVYSFWGIAPVRRENEEWTLVQKKHPFAGVTLFKTGFGGELLNLMHCVDVPLSSTYRLTRAFEFLRKWRRGF